MLDRQNTTQYIRKKCRSEIKITKQHTLIATTVTAFDFFTNSINNSDNDISSTFLVSKNLSPSYIFLTLELVIYKLIFL